MCLGTGEFLRPQGATPPGYWVYCLAPEAPQKGECRRGRRYFWPCRTRVGFGPATEPTLKTALRHIRALVGHMINNQRSADALRSHSAPRGWILHQVVAFVSLHGTFLFFSTNRLASRLNPTSSSRFTPFCFITLICSTDPFKDHQRYPSAGWSISDGPYWPVEVDCLEANTKRTLRPSGLNYSISSARPFGCTVLNARVSL